MLHNYIKTNEIIKATPSGYVITQLKGSAWTIYETNEFTNGDTADFRIVNSPRSIENNYDVFIQSKSVTVKNNLLNVENALNIESVWDKNFPETIRLKYPGVITNNSFSERRKLKKEDNYTFKI
jgi:hypothetical protein